jgi:hypothetical protein
MLTKITDNFYEDLHLVTRLLTGEVKGRPFVRYMRIQTQYLLWDEDAKAFKTAYDEFHKITVEAFNVKSDNWVEEMVKDEIQKVQD